MRRIFTLTLGVVLALALFGLPIALSALADPTLVTIETGAIRGVEADGVITKRAAKAGKSIGQGCAARKASSVRLEAYERSLQHPEGHSLSSWGLDIRTRR
jgi:hypothetical protein